MRTRTRTRNTWPREVRPAPRWQVGVSLVLAILLGRSCLADGGEEVEIKNIELECLSNEVLVGLLGVTVM